MTWQFQPFCCSLLLFAARLRTHPTTSGEVGSGSLRSLDPCPGCKGSSGRVGSDDSLNVSVRCGSRPKACQILLMVMRLSPVDFAKPRVDQCLSTRCAFQSLYDHLLHLRITHPGSHRAFRNRARHLPTILNEQRSFCALIALPLGPAAAW